MSESMVSQTSPARDSWLEVIDSDSPLLLIAPHGGRAEPRTRALLNPKVNDLHTADITRTLANRLGATVLLVHGWNIIEPRIDLGLGLRNVGGELCPPGSACVSASDDFINGALTDLAERLRQLGIKPSYGMRYPGGGVQNLLQAFSSRHRESPVAALRKISEISIGGVVDAAQLELSVALRMHGELRARCEDAIAAAFAPNSSTSRPPRTPIVVNRVPR